MNNVINLSREQSSAALVCKEQAPVRGFSNRFHPDQAKAMERSELLADLGSVYYQHLTDFVLMDAVKVDDTLRLWVVGRHVQTEEMVDVMSILTPSDQVDLTRSQLSCLWQSAGSRHAFIGDATNMLEFNAYENPVAHMAYNSPFYHSEVA